MTESTKTEGVLTLQSKSGRTMIFSLGPYETAVQTAMTEMKVQKVPSRIWARDFTLWKPEPKEISNRLGWLTVAEAMKGNIDRIKKTAQAVRAAGFTRVVLLGMGGSSLAPEVLVKVFGAKTGYPSLTVLDSTDPDAVLACAEADDLNRTLFVVSTKSGDTIETASLFKFFYRLICDRVGADKAGSQFIAITDDGSLLETYAHKFQFQNIFLNDPEIGGRYSALSYFGLLPAALNGIDVDTLLDWASDAMHDCGPDIPCHRNPAALMGTAMAILAREGRDKLTFLLPAAIGSFGDWLEQLIAESTGKEGVGILPVVGESISSPEAYGNDRFFVALRLQGDDSQAQLLSRLAAAGHPVVEIEYTTLYDIGYQFFLWEMATALAGVPLRINPFDQPNVQSAKVLARAMMTEYLERHVLPSEAPVATKGNLSVYGNVVAQSPEEALLAFLNAARPGDYIALQAFIAPSRAADAVITNLRTRIRDRYRLAVTAGYGPRYLHSTGQLHKGDGGNGLFIQLTADSDKDIGIPDEPDTDATAISFGTLKTAQALGDKQALLNAGRRVLRFHLGKDATGGLHLLDLAM